MGRSRRPATPRRGGLTSKLHALVGAEGRPVTPRLTGGQVADRARADALTDTLGEGNILIADEGCDTDVIRAKAKERKAWANIPPKTNREGGFAFSRWVYRPRDLVERFFNRINSSEASPPATTRTRKTSSQPSNSSPRGAGARVHEPTP